MEIKLIICPCGMFCKDCLLSSIVDEGLVRGIFWYFMFHTPVHLFLWFLL